MDATMYLDESAVFVKVIEVGSFSSAARQLKVPASTVSRRIQRLEDVLGVRLIQRSTRKLMLTDAGAEFFRLVSPAIGALEDAGDRVRGLSTEPSGVVRLTAPTDVSASILGGSIARFAAAYPQVSVELTITNRRVDLIGEGFDLAIRGGKMSDSSLIVMKLSTTDFWIVAAPEYLKTHGTPARLDQLIKHECVLFRGMAPWPLVGPKGDTKAEVKGRIVADDFGFVRGAVLAGAGIGFLPSVALEAYVDRGRLVRLFPRYCFPGSALSLVYPSAQHLPARVVVLRDFLLSDFAEHLSRQSEL